MHGASECHFADNPGKSDQDNEDQIGDEECGPAELADPVGEHPDVRHADGASDAGDDEAPLVIELVFCYICF